MIPAKSVKYIMDQIKVRKVYITSEHAKDKDADPEHCSTDVVVVLENGRKYIASFFSYAFIEFMRNRNSLTGEYLHGKYFWTKNMVLVENCTPDVIDPVIRDIIDEGEFNEVFMQL